MSRFGLALPVGKVFVILAFSAFALTSLDTATRIGRYVFQEFFESKNGKKSPLQNMYVATAFTVGASIVLLAYGYKNIWPVFGASNQLLAGLSLLAVSAWLAKSGKKNFMTVIPMVFMFAVTLTALLILIRNFFLGGQTLLGVIALLLLVLAIVLIVTTIKTFFGKKSKEKGVSA